MGTVSSSRHSGVALVEFTLIVPILVLLSVFAAEFGRALYEYNIVAKSVRNAARYMSMQDPADPTVRAIARRMVVYGRPNAVDGETPLARGLSMANIPDGNIAWNTAGTNPTINYVTISVTGYTFTPMVQNFFGLQIGDDDGVISFAPIRASMRGQL